MSQVPYQLIIGALGRRDNNVVVISDQGEPIKASKVAPKAKWAYARLVLGRRIADEIYHNYINSITPLIRKNIIDKNYHGKESAYALDQIFQEALRSSPKEPLQIFVKGERVVSIATSRIHSLISPSEVRDIIVETFQSQGLTSISIPQIQANNPIYITSAKSVETEFGLWQVGMAIHSGDVLTNKAIKIGSFIRIESCMNPLMWLNGGGWSNPYRNIEGKLDRDILGRGRIYLLNDRVLRWREKTEIVPRLKQTIEQVRNSVDNVVDFITENGKQKLKLSEAQAVIDALFSSYHLGDTVKEFAFSQFSKLNEEDRTVYELAIITSNLAINPEAPIKEDAIYARANLSTISAIMLSYRDIQDLVKKCNERIRARTVSR
ncbi:MAG: hypothetical protein ACPLY9_01985 [Nitrososphaerales archaeon]